MYCVLYRYIYIDRHTHTHSHTTTMSSWVNIVDYHFCNVYANGIRYNVKARILVHWMCVSCERDCIRVCIVLMWYGFVIERADSLLKSKLDFQFVQTLQSVSADRFLCISFCFPSLVLWFVSPSPSSFTLWMENINSHLVASELLCWNIHKIYLHFVIVKSVCVRTVSVVVWCDRAKYR